MSKLIYVDRLKKDILALHNCYNGFSDTYDKACIIGVIEEQPTIEERKTGKWIVSEEPPCGVKQCSVCGNRFFHHSSEDLTPYCAMCGAKMEEPDNLQLTCN